MSIIKKFTKAIISAANELSKPETYIKGEEFEEYVRKYIFPNDRYELIHKTHSYIDNKKEYIGSSVYPDFLFRCRKTGRKFYVEAKFRSGFYGDKVVWAKPYQLKRYQEINEKTPVFVCLGLGGKPKDPYYVFIIPISKLPYTGLYESFLEKFEFYTKKPVFPEYLWGLLENK